MFIKPILNKHYKHIIILNYFTQNIMMRSLKM